MKFLSIILSGISLILFAGACNCRTEKLNPGKNVVLLDVRSAEEFATKSIPGSILLPHNRIAEEITSVVPDKNTEIYLFCRSGRRSAIAAEKLAELGYINIYDLGAIECAAKCLDKTVVSNTHREP